MSNLRKKLLEQLSRFDDEAFVALANRGLLRRAYKDLEKLIPEIQKESPDELEIGFGEHRVIFDARGPSHARCSCPAGSVCQHILAVAIGLQRISQSDHAESVGDDKSADEDIVDDQLDHAESSSSSTFAATLDSLAKLREELLGLTTTELIKYAGKGGYRWAWQFIQDIDIESNVFIGGEHHVVINFARPRITFRFMGGGIDNLIVDTAINQVEKYQVAAVLAYQHAQGIQISPPESIVKADTAALDFGKDHAIASNTKADQIESRKRLCNQARQLIGESIELGLSHLSRGIYERYTTLSVWAQGAEYYRLAMLLRRIADHVELLLDRAGGADEHRLFDELTIAFGLIAALEANAVRGLAPSYLVGHARSQYEKYGVVELFGLGANAWRSSSGYLGLTMIFWSPTLKSFLSYTDARPEQQRGFDPLTRYIAPGPWMGLDNLAQATGHRIIVSNVRINDTGRLSSAPSITAAVRSPVSLEELTQELRLYSSWAVMLNERSQNRSLLTISQPMNDWVALQPKRLGAPQFDEVRQTLIWALYDDNDVCLNVELPYTDHNAHAITRVEQINSDDLAPGTIVIARLHSSATGTTAYPLSLIRKNSHSEGRVVDALHFDRVSNSKSTSKLLAKLRRFGTTDRRSLDTDLQPSVPKELLDLKHYLQRQAERGIAVEERGRLLQELKNHGAKANTAGFSLFDQLTSSDTNSADRLLRFHYCLMQYERLVGGAKSGTVEVLEPQ